MLENISRKYRKSALERERQASPSSGRPTSMAPKVLGAKRGASPSARRTAESKVQVEANRAQVCLRIRPVLTASEALEPVAMQCDRSNKLVWALSEDSEPQGDVAPKQYGFDDILEQHVGQAEVFDSIGVPAVQAALAGKVGCLIAGGASGSGKDYSLRCERPGQEGLLLRTLVFIFSGCATVAAPSAMPRPQRLDDSESAEPYVPPSPVMLSYLMLQRDQSMIDLLSMQAACIPLYSLPPTIAPLDLTANELLGPQVLESAVQWETVQSVSEVLRLLARADSLRQQDHAGSQAQLGNHTLIVLKVGEHGRLILTKLASSDTIQPEEEDTQDEALYSSFEVLGRCLDALSRTKKTAPPVGNSKLTALMSLALGGPGSQADSYTAILLCVHPTANKAVLTHRTLEFGQLSVSSSIRAKASSTVDYSALASQLMAQRDAKQEALQELELKVLRQLRPKLEEVMKQEQQIKGLTVQLQQTEWERRTFSTKEAQLQRDLEDQRQEHSQRMYALRNERSGIMDDLQQEMGSVKVGREFIELRAQHEQDVQAIGARLRALQSYVETAEAELAQQEETSTKARAVLPGAARELATMALQLSEKGQSEEAGTLFAHSLAMLEAAFGNQQPELAAFKNEVQKVVESGNAAAAAKMDTDPPQASRRPAADDYDA